LLVKLAEVYLGYTKYFQGMRDRAAEFTDWSVVEQSRSHLRRQHKRCMAILDELDTVVWRPRGRGRPPRVRPYQRAKNDGASGSDRVVCRSAVEMFDKDCLARPERGLAF